MIWCQIKRAMYGALLSVGFRTTSRFINPATPRACPSPLPPVSWTSQISSEVLVRRRPVNNVSTREVASCASAERLFLPEYGEWNPGCHCEMKFAWPEIHNRSVSGCGNIVGNESGPELSPVESAS